ncbi:hypothetical protein [Blastococcus sp. KM273129]|uniref:hypothetical protein n=1 Tax=Blastococcus sp. KM273129 TaxID=2570315 RepID=UPI001F1A58F2|nr:hypothetical protein [Blastococcus sp. KM273129]MCF6737303.1 hypothetical protein [Blastococcus sp. KM273129]
MLVRTHPYPCGSPLPAVQVHGRTADALIFPAAHGTPVAITPLTLPALLDRVPGIELAQIRQTAPAAVGVGLRSTPEADRTAVWRTLSAEMTTLLRGHGLHVAVVLDDEPPRPSPGGKYG